MVALGIINSFVVLHENLVRRNVEIKDATREWKKAQIIHDRIKCENLKTM